jgi:hypothetical protein
MEGTEGMESGIVWSHRGAWVYHVRFWDANMESLLQRVVRTFAWCYAERFDEDFRGSSRLGHLGRCAMGRGTS